MLKEYDIDVKVGEHSLYSEETNGKFYVSIDLKKANFQALKFAGVLDDVDYDHFMYKYGADEYIRNSKYLRQVIFGKMTVIMNKKQHFIVNDINNFTLN